MRIGEGLPGGTGHNEMELPVLILVNIITAIVIYFFFSLRFSRAVEKARRNSIVRDLRENVESAVEFINASIEIIDRKTRTFYELVRRSEELVGRLEVLRDQSGVSREDFPPADLSPEVPPGEVPEESAPLERVLQRSPKDRLELSPVGRTTDEILESAHLSRAPQEGATQTAKSLPLRILEGTGQVVGKIFGVGGESLSESTKEKRPEIVTDSRLSVGESVEPPVSDRGGTPETFEKMLDRARFPAVSEQPDRTTATPDHSTAKPDHRIGTPDPHEEAGDGEQERRDIEGAIRSFLEGEGLTSFPPAGDVRARLVRFLVGAGYSSLEIALGSGIALAEIELTAAFPPGISRRRRRRKTEN